MPDPNTSNSDIAAANPIQPTSSQPDAGPITSTPNMGTIPPVQPQASPAQATTAQPQTSTTVNPATLPNPAQVRQQAHADLFKSFLGTLAGGGNRPVMNSNGQPATDSNGQVIMAPASKKTLAASILAGALSGLAASMSKPTNYQELPGGRVVADNSAAVGAAMNAAQPFTQAGAQAGAQKTADDFSAKAYSTVDHNLKLHAAQLTNLKLQGDLLQNSVDNAAPIIEALENAGPIQDPNDPTKTIDPIQESNVSETRLQQMMADGSTHVTRDSVLPDGVVNVYDADGKQVFNSDGTPRQENSYTVYNHNAQVAMTAAMKGLSPNLKDVAQGTAVPVAVLAKYAYGKQVQSAATTGLQNQLKEYDDVNGTKSNFSLQSAIDKNPIIKLILPQIGKYGTDSVDVMFKDLQKDKTVSSAALGALQTAMGVTPAGLQKMADKRAVDLKMSEKGADALPASPALVASFKQTVKINNPELTAGQIDSLAKGLGPNPTQKDYKDALEQAGKQADRNTTRNAARTKLDDAGQRQLFDYGVSGDTRLNLDNAPDSMLVDSRTGNPVPYKMTSTLKPTMQESNRKDFAISAIHSLDALNNLIVTNEAKFGPVTGPVDKWMSQHGLGDQYQQAALNYLTFAQSAATGAHVGGRFNVPIMDKMATTVNVNMDKDQLKGATDSIKDVMQQYVDQGGRMTVADYRGLSPESRKKLMTPAVPQQPLYRRDPVTKAVQQSTDGGKSWQ